MKVCVMMTLQASIDGAPHLVEALRQMSESSGVKIAYLARGVYAESDPNVMAIIGGFPGEDAHQVSSRMSENIMATCRGFVRNMQFFQLLDP